MANPTITIPLDPPNGEGLRLGRSRSETKDTGFIRPVAPRAHFRRKPTPGTNPGWSRTESKSARTHSWFIGFIT